MKSTDTNIIFTVQRFIYDQLSYPYRAFSLNDAYEIKMSTALLLEEFTQLSDPQIEEKQRNNFIKEAYLRDEEYVSVKEEEVISIDTVVKKSMNFTKNYAQHGISEKLNEYIKEVKVISADKFSKFWLWNVELLQLHSLLENIKFIKMSASHSMVLNHLGKLN